MGPDLDLQDDRILGAGEVGEGPATPSTPALLGRQDLIFRDSREVRVVASGRSGPAGSLAPRSPWGWVQGLRGGGSGRCGGLGLAAEELLLAEAELGLESFDLGLELSLAI
jgi:hypothetical protein